MKETCPSCKSDKGYTIIGKQEIPPKARKEFGGKKELTLVTCLNCGTTTTKREWK